MQIGLDIDEVVCSLVPEILDSVNDVWGVRHSIDIFSTYNFFANSYTECEKTNKDIATDIIKWVNDPEYLYKAQPYAGVAEFVSTLLSQGHEVHFITARPQSTFDATLNWFHKYGIPYTSINVIGNSNCKGVLGKDLGLDIYVDDHVDNIEAMVKNTNIINFLIARPWNIYYNNDNVIRIKELQELGRYLDATRRDKKRYGHSY